MTVPPRRHLFTPVQIGPITLKHRVVMAPLTRSRSEQPGDIPGRLMLEYYAQRASDGGFIVSEGTSVSLTGRGWLGAPGLYSDQQVEGWKKITAAVHAKGGYMFSQLCHTGRSSARRDGGWPHAGLGFRRSVLLGGCVARRFGTQRLDQALTASRPRYWRDSGHHRGLFVKPPSGRRLPASTASNCMPPMAICPIGFFRTAATSAPTLMVAASKTAHASRWNSWRR
jgi:hypothetical protein